MRIIALILFFPFAVFFVETASFPMAVKATCGQTVCTKDGMREMKCHAKSQGKKPPRKCDNTADCSVCPICQIFIFQPAYEWPSKSFLSKKNYGLINSVYVSSYISSIWKPPNGCSLHSETT